MNLSITSLFKIPEIRKKLLITLGLLLVYRIGFFIPLPGVEICILDEKGNRLGPNQTGEIATRSAANMKGYWRKPDATASSTNCI